MTASLGAQLGAVFRAVAALARFPTGGGARGLLLVYTLLVAAVFAGVGWAMTTGRPALTQALLGYVFPADWLPWVEPLFRGMAGEQSNLVFVNATLMLGISCVAALLFRLKERLSRAFERGQTWAPTETESEFPLWFQIFEETRIFLIYVSLQLTFFWIGLSADPTRRVLASVLSTVFLWVQLTLDFGSPGLQRRRRRYADIARLLLRRPIAALAFGAIFTAPPQLAGLWVAEMATEHPERALGILFAVTLVALPLAVLAGTRLASELLPLDFRPLVGVRRALGHLGVACLIAVNLASAGLALRTLHHMSQVLKCDYALVPDSWKVSTALLDTLLSKRLDVEGSIELEVRNPTPFDLSLADLAIDIRHQDQTVATPQLTGLAVPAGETRRQRLTLRLPVELKTLSQGLALLEPGWEVRLRLQVLPGTELPIYLLRR